MIIIKIIVKLEYLPTRKDMHGCNICRSLGVSFPLAITICVSEATACEYENCGSWWRSGHRASRGGATSSLTSKTSKTRCSGTPSKLVRYRVFRDNASRHRSHSDGAIELSGAMWSVNATEIHFGNPFFYWWLRHWAKSGKPIHRTPLCDWGNKLNNCMILCWLFFQQ